MVKLFGSKNDTGVDTAPTPATTTEGKGRPTPTRREREQANLRPLVSNDRKAANRDARATLAQERERARVGMAAGEEKYLRLVDRGPQRKWVRDYIDARFNVGEALIPILLVYILGSFIPQIAPYLFLLIWLFFLATIVDVLILGRILKRRITAKFGEGSLQKGMTWYAAMRAIQLRPMRLPKPQVKRFAYPS